MDEIDRVRTRLEAAARRIASEKRAIGPHRAMAVVAGIIRTEYDEAQGAGTLQHFADELLAHIDLYRSQVAKSRDLESQA